MASVNDKRILSIDEILPLIGEFGRFQKILDCMTFIIFFPVAFHPFIMYFATIVPPWKCVNNGSMCSSNGTFPSDETSRCNMPRNEWYYVEKKEFSLVTQFDLHCNEKWILHLVTSIFFVGWGFGAIIIGLIADRYGRKKFIFPSVAVVLVAGFITPFMPNIYLVVVCRFIIGFFYPGVTVQSFILLSELVGNKQRPLATLVPYLSYPTAWIILALQAYLLNNWKLLSIICTVPYIFVFAFFTFIPESVRWLQLHGRADDAMHIFRKIAHWNKKDLSSDIIISSPEMNISPKSNPLDIFRTRKIALQSSIQIYIWIFIGLNVDGLQLASDDLQGSVYRDFILLCTVEYPSTFIAIIVCKTYGRKKAALIPLLIGGAACLGIAFIPERGNLNIARIILGIVGKLFSSVTFHALYIWSAEIFPTDVRASAMGVLQVSSRVGSACSPWVVKGLKSFGMWIPFTVLGFTTMGGSVLGMWLPETIDRVLKESVNQNDKEIASSNEAGDKESIVVRSDV